MFEQKLKGFCATYVDDTFHARNRSYWKNSKEIEKSLNVSRENE